MKKIALVLSTLLCLAQNPYALAAPITAIDEPEFGFTDINRVVREPQDTIRIKIGNDKEVLIYVADKAALKSLQTYDLNKLVREIVAEADSVSQISKATNEQLIIVTEENGEEYKISITSRTTRSSEETSIETTEDGDLVVEIDEVEVEIEDEIEIEDAEVDKEDSDITIDWRKKKNKKEHKRTTSSVVFDLGMNNFTNDGDDFIQNGIDYSVKTWGSWYVGIGQVYQTHISGPLAIQWGGNISWYNFKFENPEVLLIKNDTQSEFILNSNEDLRGNKSKLTMTHLNVSVVPMLDFGYSKEKVIIDGQEQLVRRHNSSAFTLGLGGYAGYRIGSSTVFKFDEDGQDDKKSTNSNFNLNNWRYGLRLQLGIQDVDVFVNYDLNELFRDNRGPKVNAFSFGINF